jgi:cytochrome bd ubiquinol oxidase subunit II
MIEEVFSTGRWLPYTFAFLIGFSFLLYALLDGYDLGVGILSRNTQPEERDRMIASIAPFWDANETWLVLGAGLILVAFPAAHGIIFSELYLPVLFMLIGIIFRGVSFDFRKKCHPKQQVFWNKSFFGASLLTAASQGYMMGLFITGFQKGFYVQVFAFCFMGLVISAYCLMGANWLVLKCEGKLQARALQWSKTSIKALVIAAILSTLSAPMIDTRIYSKMFSFPEISVLIVLPVMGLVLTTLMYTILRTLPLPNDKLSWMPLVISMVVIALGFQGLVYSFYPYIIPGHMQITDAAASTDSLKIILVGTVFVLPFLAGYTIFAYRIFRGKAQDLHYD